jgi:hypothetical protein
MLSAFGVQSAGGCAQARPHMQVHANAATRSVCFTGASPQTLPAGIGGPAWPQSVCAFTQSVKPLKAPTITRRARFIKRLHFV